MRYFEDFRVGEEREVGAYTVTREAILAFAREFDPQPFHLEEEAARRSIFGGLVASGWHTAAICMRLSVDGLVGETASMGSPGVDELRWLVPVRPGDTLSLRVRCVETTLSRSKPDRGSIRFDYELLNQRREIVMRMRAIGIIARRPA